MQQQRRIPKQVVGGAVGFQPFEIQRGPGAGQGGVSAKGLPHYGRAIKVNDPGESPRGLGIGLQFVENVAYIGRPRNELPGVGGFAGLAVNQGLDVAAVAAGVLQQDGNKTMGGQVFAQVTIGTPIGSETVGNDYHGAIARRGQGPVKIGRKGTTIARLNHTVGFGGRIGARLSQLKGGRRNGRASLGRKGRFHGGGGLVLVNGGFLNLSPQAQGLGQVHSHTGSGIVAQQI